MPDLADAFVVLGVLLLLLAFISDPALILAALGVAALRYGLNRSR